MYSPSYDNSSDDSQESEMWDDVWDLKAVEESSFNLRLIYRYEDEALEKADGSTSASLDPRF